MERVVQKVAIVALTLFSLQISSTLTNRLASNFNNPVSFVSCLLLTEPVFFFDGRFFELYCITVDLQVLLWSEYKELWLWEDEVLMPGYAEFLPNQCTTNLSTFEVSECIWESND